MEEKLVSILNEMAEYLSISQMKKLQEVLLKNLAVEPEKQTAIDNPQYLKMFLDRACLPCRKTIQPRKA